MSMIADSPVALLSNSCHTGWMDANNLYSASSMPTRDVEKARLDETILRLKLELSNVYYQRNFFSSIFRFPTEILESIFVHCARHYHNNSNGYPTPIAPSWVSVSYVCRHWRNVALNCPTLWTYLFVTSPRWTKELLARSKQAPLKLHITVVAYPVSLEFCFAGPVRSHVERIQDLHLHIPGGITVTKYLSFLSSPAPVLQNLKISTESRYSSRSSVLFNGDTPALRTLDLSYCPVPWYSFKLISLTTLSLHHVPARFQQDTKEFLGTLSCMQDLQNLYLCSALGSAAGFLSSAAFRTFPKITLPRLSRLWIDAPLSAVIALLSCINLPSKTEVRLHCHFERGPSLEDFPPLPSLLAQRFNMSDNQTPSNPKIRSLVVQSKEWEGVRLRLNGLETDCETFDNTTDLEWGCNIPLKIWMTLGHSSTENNCDRVLTDVCCSLPLTHLQSLHVIDPPFSSAFWRKTFGRLQDLRYLKLSKGSIPDLASMLIPAPNGCTENQGEYADGGPNQMFAPALEELELDEIRFAPEKRSERDMHTPVTDVESLCLALSSHRPSMVIDRSAVEYGRAPGTWSVSYQS